MQTACTKDELRALLAPVRGKKIVLVPVGRCIATLFEPGSRAGIPTEQPALNNCQAVSRLRHSGRFTLPFPSISCGIVAASAGVSVRILPRLVCYLSTISTYMQAPMAVRT